MKISNSKCEIPNPKLDNSKPQIPNSKSENSKFEIPNSKSEKFKSELLTYPEINSEWKRSKMDPGAAKILTVQQVNAFEKIVSDDAGWELLLSAFNDGRDTDAWLAADWPDGFDELLLCVPLCKLVDFECSKCTVGRRQENNSCAHDYSLFGYIAELLKIPDRQGVFHHINVIKKILLSEDCKWNVSDKTLEEF